MSPSRVDAVNPSEFFEMAYSDLGPPKIKVGICDACPDEGLDDAVGDEFQRLFDIYGQPVFSWFGGDEELRLCVKHLREWLTKLEGQNG